MSFESPWLLALAAPFLVAIALTLRTTESRTPRALVSAALRALTILALAAALARPHQPHHAPVDGITALVDLSSSVTDQQGDTLLSRARSLAADLNVPLTIVPFSKNAGTPTPETSFRSLRSKTTHLDHAATSIESALGATKRSATQLAFLLSDGYETAGHALVALDQGVSAKVFPLTVDGPSDAQQISISQLNAPQIVKSQQRADIRVTLSNPSSEPSRGKLSIKHGPSEILSQEVSLPAERDTTFSALSDPTIEGLHRIVATYSWTDTSGSHAVSRSSWLSGEKRDKVLVLSGTPEDDRFLSQILRGQSYQLRSEIASRVTSSDLGAPGDYRTIVLNNVAASAVPSPFSEAIPAFVRSGGGLITIGGDRSYGLGGYIGSHLETLLPVRLVPPHVEKKRLNVAVQLVIDKSRSMAMDSRLDFAKAAAREVLSSLKDDDYIGVIGFDDVPFIALPLSPVGAVRSSAPDRISRLYPTKKTNLFPALDEARRGLARINAGRKHTIVLTDGKLPDPGTYYYDLVKQMRILGVTVSTVVVGSDADDGFLARLAEIGGGAFYQTANPQNLPKIFLSDVKVASNERSLIESQNFQVSQGPSGITSTRLSEFPMLRGFVETLQRDGARTELIVSNAEKSYPLLASWSVERGKVVSFTSDANGRWSSQWMPWRSINEFWSEVVESTIALSGKARSNIDFDLRSWVEGGELIVDLSLFDDIGALPITGTLSRPTKERSQLTFTATSAGHYQARLPKASPGTHTASILLGDASLPDIAWEIADDTFSESPHAKPNTPLLQQIASRSGGTLNPTTETLARYLETENTRRDLSHHCVCLALLLFLLEVLLRLKKRVSHHYAAFSPR